MVPSPAYTPLQKFKGEVNTGNIDLLDRPVISILPEDLSFILSILHLHGSLQLFVASVSGRGSNFLFWFPQVPDAMHLAYMQTKHPYT